MLQITDHVALVLGDAIDMGMTRPHEDLERHQPTDHRLGGVPVTFAVGAWCAVDIVQVKASRNDAGVSSYETLIEQARTSSARVTVAAVLRSVNERRVIALIEIPGHDAFRHLRSAWDDHHLAAKRHDVAESTALALYRVVASAGAASVDPGSHDGYAFERVAIGPDRAPAIVAAIKTAPGFSGALVLAADDGSAMVIVYRFAHMAALDAFRESAAAAQVLGPVGADGESISAVQPVRTFG
jgi:hypothetical protein